MAARVCEPVSHGFAYLQVGGRNFKGERKGQGQEEGKKERILLEGIQRSCEKISYSELLFKDCIGRVIIALRAKKQITQPLKAE